MFNDCSKQVRFEGTLGSDGVFSSGTLLANTYNDSRMIVNGVKFNGFPMLYASSEFVTDKASHCLQIFFFHAIVFNALFASVYSNIDLLIVLCTKVPNWRFVDLDGEL